MKTAWLSTRTVTPLIAQGPRVSDDEVREVVEMVIVNTPAPLPAGIVADGQNAACEPMGSPVTANVTGFEYVPFEGVYIRLKGAGWPEITVSEEARGEML
jgi:hypothetical protein